MSVLRSSAAKTSFPYSAKSPRETAGFFFWVGRFFNLRADF
jgi:hypothetical protein